ncbi:glycoside hydrolase [Mesorhizobium sp. M4B.F.Ca.ET.089.01.1.1]|uniref:glycoside hydrolase family protein n=1 Tax=Mesorhizobium sp. M4B.F.Ca.ET.089.01.1.1 TaxID=2496662 RepID=UPI000FE435E9|nr:glycoside hydrolase family protein [Mesorhizobium sp. M4B.F.Ca.ET.089.01.1.1]RWX60544.1 glycoside hydrolase [Mesorhizobium sp. M4B.F.Ca.ET.089.01.1.1]
MPIGKIRVSPRAVGAVAAALVAVSTTTWNAYIASRPDPAVVAIHAAIDKGLTPPAVELAIDKLILPWEGLVLKAHWDRFSKQYDICHGETRINGKPVTKDMTFTPAECKAMLVERVIHDFYLPLVDGVKDYAIAPLSVQAAMLSGAYNFGAAGQKKSRTAQFVTKHEYHTACLAQTAWNKAGGEVVPGLVKRREMGDAQRIGEAELCVSGLDLKEPK